MKHRTMLRIGDDQELKSLTHTTLSEHGFKEEDLRNWILDTPESILGEDILIIGREVQVKNIGDAIDLLGIDRDGNVVVIELKQGSLSGNVDFQSLKYSAYTSYWDWGQLADQFDKFCESQWGKHLYDENVEFNQKIESFCNDGYELNGDQRILLIGESIRERLDLVVRWLSERDIGISVLEVQLLEENDQLYVDTEQVLPVPQRSVSGVDPNTDSQPWKNDGRSWHLEEKLDEPTAELLTEIAESLGDIESLDGPHWGQKQYVSFTQNRKNRLIARTRTRVFKLELYDIDTSVVDVDELSKAVGVDTDDISVYSEDLRGGRPGVRIACRGKVEIDKEQLKAKFTDYLERSES